MVLITAKRKQFNVSKNIAFREKVDTNGMSQKPVCLCPPFLYFKSEDGNGCAGGIKDRELKERGEGNPSGARFDK